ncbi:hypothetical protein ABKV19_001062 [Rosa sericea]
MYTQNVVSSLQLSETLPFSFPCVSSLQSLSNLTNLSFRRNGAITSHGMSAFANLFVLIKLDLERCPGIHGGLVHLQGY